MIIFLSSPGRTHSRVSLVLAKAACKVFHGMVFFGRMPAECGRLEGANPQENTVAGHMVLARQVEECSC